MTDRQSTDAASRWHADATTYDAWFDQPWGRYATRIEHDLVLDAIGPVDGLDVCDAGCGTGRFTARLEGRGASAIGVDTDPATIEIARTRIAGEVVEADVHHLPFDDARFDITVAMTCASSPPTLPG